MVDDPSSAQEIFRLPVAELFRQACAVAGRDVPKGAEESRQFAQDCVAAAKVKAELLAKAMPEPIQHSKALQFVVNFCLFQSWHDFVSFAKRFPEIPETQRNSFRETYCLATALWTLRDCDLDVPIVKAMRTFQNTLLASIDEDVRGELLSRVMWKQESGSWLSKQDRAQDSYGLSEEEVLYALNDFLGISRERLLLAILGCRPLEDGRRANWPPLQSVKVSTILAQRLALRDSDAGFGQLGWEHGVAYILSELDAYATLSPAASAGLFGDDRDIRAEQTLLRRKARATGTRLTSKAALHAMLKPVMNSTVLQALTRTERSSGFFNEFYQGSPESVEKTLIEEYSETYETPIKRIVFREPLGDVYLTIFRWRMPTDESSHRLYEVEAVLHNAADDLVAKVGLALYYANELPTAYDLAWALDEHDDDDLREVGVCIAQRVSKGEIDEDDLGRVMVVRDWEVRAGDRGRGLGPLLLSAAVEGGTRGLPNAHVVALRLDPLKYPVPPMNDWYASDYPELFEAFADLDRCWNKVSGPGSVFARKKMQIVRTSYIPACHGGSHMQLLSLPQVPGN